MAAVFIAPFYVAANVLIMLDCLHWLKTMIGFFKLRPVQITFAVFFLFLMSSPVIAFLMPAGQAQRFMKSLGNLWMGIFLYLALFIVIGKLVGLILCLTHVSAKEVMRNGLGFRITGAAVLVCTVLVCVNGLTNAQNIKVTNYSVETAKSGGKLSGLKIVLISDLHLGYNAGTAMMKQMVEKVNAQDPDIILCAGDVFDNEYEALDDPAELEKILSGMKSRYGAYCVMGNHDIEEPILGGFTFPSSSSKVTDPRFIRFVKDSGMTLLSDESVLIDDSFYVVGRLDYEEPGNETKTRKTEAELLNGLDTSKLLIDLDHEPRNLQQAADAGFDLDLAGHTHAGQVWPGTEIIKFFWQNASGYLKVGNMHSIVTDGVGSFGPYMRTMCDAEICTVNVNFSG